MRPPSSQHDAQDRGLAAAARQPCAQVDAVLELKEPSHSVGVHIIGDRGAAQPDGVLQNLAQGEPQPLKLHPGHPPRPPARPDAGAKQALVGVDVAHSGKQRLVQQGSLDGQVPAAEERGKRLRPNRKRLCPRPAETRASAQIAELQPPKPARVHKAKLTAAGKAQADVRMGGNGTLGSGDEQPPGHAEMHDPLGLWRAVRPVCTEPAVRRPQLADDVLSRAMHGQNRAPLKPPGLSRRRSLERLAVPAEPDLDDVIAAQTLVYAAGNGFHLRKFWHRSIVEDYLCSPGARILLASKLTIFHTPR